MKRLLNKEVSLSCLCLTLLITGMANASSKDKLWAIELGYIDLEPNDSSSEISGPGLPPGNALDVGSSDSVFGSINYNINENWGVQAYLAPWMEFEIDAAGSLTGVGHVSTVDALFPTVFVNYTVTQFSNVIKPFVGLAANYTLFNDEVATPVLAGALGGDTSVSLDNSLGYAYQFGVSVDFNENWYAKLGYVWIDVNTTATITTPAVGTVRTVDVEVDPSTAFVSIGYKF